MRKWLLVLLVFVFAFPAGAFAGAYITGTEIVDRSIKTVDLGKGAVKKNKIYPSAVATGKIANAAVTTAKLAPGAVTLAKTTGLAASTHNHDADYYTVAEMNYFFDYFDAFEAWCASEHGVGPASIEMKNLKAKIEGLKK